MSVPVDPQNALKRRLLRPLPTPGAGKRVRAQKPQPANTAESKEPASSQTKEESTHNEDNLQTPIASMRELPLQSEAPTPKVPVIQLNGNPVTFPSETNATFIVDEAKDAELREKFLKMQIQEQPKRVIPKLKIPKKVKPPPKPVQRRMARVKPTVKTAPRPEISFGPITAFGESETGQSSKEAAEKKPEAPAINLQALKRRQNREKKERLGIARARPRLAELPLPDTSEEDEEESNATKGDKKPRNMAKDGDANESEGEADDIEERKRKSREKMKQVTLMMARDIQKWRIPKSKLKEMAKGKTEEETAARKRVLELAWKIAKQKQAKQKHETEENAADVEEAPKNTSHAGEPTPAESKEDDDEEGDDKPKKVEKKDGIKARKTGGKHHNAKGKQRATGWSMALPSESSK